MPTKINQTISIKRMSKLFIRISTGLMLLILVWSCGQVPGLQEESTGSYIRLPFVRVLLAESNEKQKITGEGAIAIECLKDGTQEIYYSGKSITLKSENSHLSVYNYKGDPIREHLDEVNIIPRGSGSKISFKGKKYRGIIRIIPVGEVLRFINIVYMEDYLKGVVPPEIGKRAESEIEAVKAQAVAARTYAMAHLRQYEGQAYDMRSSIMDQVYDGATVENRLVNNAIKQTSGRVVMYHDELINAYYHSTCGGMTDDIADVWDKKEIGYLKPVHDSAACSWSKYYTWREHFTEKQLRGRLEQYLASDRGRDLRISEIRDITIRDRTPGGRVKKLLVRTDNDVYRFQKDRIRWVIGRTSNPDLILPSDNFDITLKRDKSNNLLSVTFKGRGYGHGVGMCQCGAIGLSRIGWEYDRILKHYYTNVELKKLY